MEPNEKKPYIPPKIVFEADLETKAGSPLGTGTGEGDGLGIFPGIDE